MNWAWAQPSFGIANGCQDEADNLSCTGLLETYKIHMFQYNPIAAFCVFVSNKLGPPRSTEMDTFAHP